MLTVDAARAAILQLVRPLAAEDCPLADAAGRVLAEDLTARRDFPAFDNAAVDGYGVRSADTADAAIDRPVHLACLGTVAAGSPPPDAPLKPGHTWRVFTGAVIPPGVDAMVMREDSAAHGARIAIHRPAVAGDHVRRRAESFAAGATVLRSGIVLRAAALGVAAMCGRPTVTVVRRPRVVIIVTGDELVPPGADPAPGQIFESNSWTLAALVRESGGDMVRAVQAPDEMDRLGETFAAALRDADVVVSVGGVSVGDRDFVKPVCESLGVETVLWGVSMKPGKPNYVGEWGGNGRRTVVFGLPGNPVSAAVSFIVLARPALHVLGGRPVEALAAVAAQLRVGYQRRAGREEFLRAVATPSPTGWQVEPLAAQGSHLLAGLAAANCLVRVPADVAALAPGADVGILWL